MQPLKQRGWQQSLTPHGSRPKWDSASRSNSWEAAPWCALSIHCKSTSCQVTHYHERRECDSTRKVHLICIDYFPSWFPYCGVIGTAFKAKKKRIFPWVILYWTIKRYWIEETFGYSSQEKSAAKKQDLCCIYFYCCGSEMKLAFRGCFKQQWWSEEEMLLFAAHGSLCWEKERGGWFKDVLLSPSWAWLVVLSESAPHQQLL